jgi:hypothetical protein
MGLAKGKSMQAARNLNGCAGLENNSIRLNYSAKTALLRENGGGYQIPIQ